MKIICVHQWFQLFLNMRSKKIVIRNTQLTLRSTTKIQNLVCKNKNHTNFQPYANKLYCFYKHPSVFKLKKIQDPYIFNLTKVAECSVFLFPLTQITFHQGIARAQSELQVCTFFFQLLLTLRLLFSLLPSSSLFLWHI